MAAVYKKQLSGLFGDTESIAMAAKKAVKAEVYLEGLGNDICSPFFDKYNALHFCFQNSGDVVKLDHNARVKDVHSTGGQPSAALFDADGELYITDFAHGAVLLLQEEQQEALVSVYEDKPLKGPNSIVVDSKGTIYFTDSGPMGETGIHNPTGSLYMISSSASGGGNMLQPISFENLASPAGIALSPNGKLVYVAETMTNRVLRFFQQPEGVFHGSVFYQNSGGVGPTALAVDRQGSIYVAAYDVKESSKEGKVLIISPDGTLVNTIVTLGPEISGLSINKNTLYITEKSTGSIQTVAL
jgi:sugar lactone lactonase YvrE